MDKKQKFISGQVVEVWKDEQLQKATITNVGNFYLHARIGEDWEKRFLKTDFQGMTNGAQKHKENSNDGNKEA